MGDVLGKARADLAGELTQAIDKNAAHRRKKEKNRAALGGLALGLVQRRLSCFNIVHATSGFPWYVQRKGFAMVALK